ncbi:MAG TPA: multicopper oxidase family protein [Steroidobacteraceae bacterium]|nr:multicopper oxidase family protein [Steroidobacteraceae bacterium]
MLRREFLQSALTLGAGAMSWMLVPKLSAREAAREQVDVTLVGRPYRFAADTGADFDGLAYNGRVPGQLLRVRYGQRLRARYLNRTGGPSTVHWHGMILPNAMDGVPDVTQKPVPNGGEFIYTFKPDPPGFRWYHSHVGDQIALGLFGPFLIEDPGEARADVEVVLVLHDVPRMSSLRAALAGRSNAAMDVPPGVGGMAGMSGQGASSMHGMSGMQGTGAMKDMSGMGDMSAMPGMGAMARGRAMGDEVAYLSHCLSGAAYPHTRPLTVRVGQTVRLRILNASPTLTHYVRLGGHQLRITHSDGNPLPRAVTVDALRIGVGERYDAWFEVTKPGAWLLQSLMADVDDRRQAVLIRTPDAADREPELPPSSLRAAKCFDYLLAGGEHAGGVPARMSAGTADARGRRQVSVDLTLGGGEPGTWRWTIDGKIWPHTPKVQVRAGDQVLIRFRNPNDMDHPMHLHGHIFELVELSGRRLENPLRKDTALVPAHGSAAWRFIADAPPGRWLLHCHNLVHMMDGMVTEVDYL